MTSRRELKHISIVGPNVWYELAKDIFSFVFTIMSEYTNISVSELNNSQNSHYKDFYNILDSFERRHCVEKSTLLILSGIKQGFVDISVAKNEDGDITVSFVDCDCSWQSNNFLYEGFVKYLKRKNFKCIDAKTFTTNIANL